MLFPWTLEIHGQKELLLLLLLSCLDRASLISLSLKSGQGFAAVGQSGRDRLLTHVNLLEQR